MSETNVLEKQTTSIKAKTLLKSRKAVKMLFATHLGPMLQMLPVRRDVTSELGVFVSDGEFAGDERERERSHGTRQRLSLLCSKDSIPRKICGLFLTANLEKVTVALKVGCTQFHVVG